MFGFRRCVAPALVVAALAGCLASRQAKEARRRGDGLTDYGSSEIGGVLQGYTVIDGRLRTAAVPAD